LRIGEGGGSWVGAYISLSGGREVKFLLVKTIVIVATLDTRGDEVKYLKELI